MSDRRDRRERPEKGPSSASSGAEARPPVGRSEVASSSTGPTDRTDEAPAYLCDLCGHPMLDLHCKLICERCGYKRDCSDP